MAALALTPALFATPVSLQEVDPNREQLDVLLGEQKRQSQEILKLSTKLAAGARSLEEQRDLLEIAWRQSVSSGSRARQAHQAYALCQVLVATGERDRARAIAEQALDGLPDSDARQCRLHALLAQLANVRQDWTAALAHLDLAEARSAQDPQPGAMRAQIQGIRGQIALQMGLVDVARPAILAERDLVEALPASNAILDSGVAIHLADLRLATDEWEVLTREVNASLEKNGGWTDRPATRGALLLRRGIAELALEVSDPDRVPTSVQTFEEVLSLRASVPQHERISAHQRLVEVHLRAGTQAGLTTAAEHLAAIDAELEKVSAEPLAPLDRAFIDALRFRLVRRAASSEDDIAAAEQALRDSAESLRAEFERTKLRPGGIGFFKATRIRSVFSARIDAELGVTPDAASTQRAFEMLLDTLEVSTLSRRLGGPEPTVERLRRELLGSSDILLVFFPARDGGHVFALGDETLTWSPLPPEYEIEPWRRRLLRDVMVSPAGLNAAERDARLTRLIEAGDRLGEHLLPKPIFERVEAARSVTIASPDLMGYLPYELVRTTDRWQGLRRAVGYAPTCSIALALLRRAPLASSDARTTLLVAAPNNTQVQGIDVPAPLRFEDSDFRALKEASNAPWKLLAGDDATFASWAEELPKHRLSQVLLHGIQHPDLERSAGLLFAATNDDDGAVWVDRLETLEEVSDVLILTACRSGRGPQRIGDPGASTLLGVLLERGARAALLPRGDLAYRPALDFSLTLHEQLRDGVPLAAAALYARQELAANPDTSDPFYWGLLHVEGAPSVRVAETRLGETAHDTDPLQWGVLIAMLSLIVLFGISLFVGFYGRPLKPRQE